MVEARPTGENDAGEETLRQRSRFDEIQPLPIVQDVMRRVRGDRMTINAAFERAGGPDFVEFARENVPGR